MIVAAALLGCAAAPAAGQGLTSGPYELPYKNTYGGFYQFHFLFLA